MKFNATRPTRRILTAVALEAECGVELAKIAADVARAADIAAGRGFDNGIPVGSKSWSAEARAAFAAQRAAERALQDAQIRLRALKASQRKAMRRWVA